MVVLACNIIGYWLRTDQEREFERRDFCPFCGFSPLSKDRPLNHDVENLRRIEFILENWHGTSLYHPLTGQREAGRFRIDRRRSNHSNAANSRQKIAFSSPLVHEPKLFAMISNYPLNLHENWQGVSSLYNKSSDVSAGNIRRRSEFEFVQQ